jgi:hypothetical protein
VAFRWSAGMLWATKWTTATMQAVAKRGGERERERERERECIGQRNWRKVLEIRRRSFPINISTV